MEGDVMLILTRRVGEALMVGDDTKIVVLGVKGSQIRLGIGGEKLKSRVCNNKIQKREVRKLCRND